MDLHQNTLEQANLITTIDEKLIVVNDKTYAQSLIITKGSLIEIEINCIADLTDDHIKQLLASNPEIVILGSGANHIFPAVELLNPIALKNIGFEVMNNQSAARTYNILIAEERKAACLLLI